MKICLRKYRSSIILVVLASICDTILNLGMALILREVMDTALRQDLNEFRNVLLFAIVFLIFEVFASYGYQIISKKIINNVIKNYRKLIFNGLVEKDFRTFNKVNTADYMSALTNDMKMIEENYLEPLLLLVQNAFIFVGTIIMLFFLSPLITGLLIITSMLMFLVPMLFGKSLEKRQERVSKQNVHFVKVVKDLLSGFEVIRSFGVSKQAKEMFQQDNLVLAGVSYKAEKMIALNASISTVLATLSQFVVIFMAAYLIIQGEISAGTTLALIQLSGSFIMPVLTLMSNVPKIQSVKTVINRLDAIATIEASGEANPLPTLNQRLEIKNLTFSYNDEDDVLDRLNLNIEVNHKYALLGQSGSGKSTLVKLISGYYDNYKGEVNFDSKELSSLNMRGVNQMISLIHQNVYMFDEDIHYNICLGEEFSEELLDDALARSGVDLFVHTIDDGLSYKVGENGSRLSGGQRQRIAVARALIRKTPVLVLDEGTSAIDKQTAYDIEQKLMGIKDLTLISITHNMDEALLGKYDELIYMHEGKVYEQGHYNELIKAKGAVYQAVNLSEKDYKTDL